MAKIRAAFNTYLQSIKLDIFKALIKEAGESKKDKSNLPIVEPRYAQVELQLHGVAELAALRPVHFEQGLLRDLSLCLRLSPGRLYVCDTAGSNPLIVTVRISACESEEAQRGEPSVRGAVLMLRDQLRNSRSMLRAGEITQHCFETQFQAEPQYGESFKKYFADCEHIDDFLKSDVGASSSSDLYRPTGSSTQLESLFRRLCSDSSKQAAARREVCCRAVLPRCDGCGAHAAASRVLSGTF